MFVLFDPVNTTEALKSKLKDFLGEQTDQFVEWFSKVISQVDNQVAKGKLLFEASRSFLLLLAISTIIKVPSVLQYKLEKLPKSRRARKKPVWNGRSDHSRRKMLQRLLNLR